MLNAKTLMGIGNGKYGCLIKALKEKFGFSHTLLCRSMLIKFKSSSIDAPTNATNVISSIKEEPGDVMDLDHESFQEIGASMNDTENSGLVLPGHRIRGILCPTLDTHASIVAGQSYSQLPIAHVVATYQNTHVIVTDATGTKTYGRSSGGRVGFKNAKKKTNVAAQCVGMSVGQFVIAKGLTHLRVQIKGMGKGRLAACKGLEQAGLQIVSLTDNSRLDWGALIPRKKKRL